MLKQINFWLLFLTVVVMGISVGAMLGEQQTLVPYWKEMNPDAFYIWYGENALRLKGFFAPWQIASLILSLLAILFCRIQRHPGTIWLGISAVFSIAVLMTFFLFFKETNASFIAQTIPAKELSDVLSKWSMWQWVRISLGASAFCAALYGITRAPS